MICTSGDEARRLAVGKLAVGAESAAGTEAGAVPATTISMGIQLSLRSSTEPTVFVTTIVGNGHYAGFQWTRPDDAATKAVATMGNGAPPAGMTDVLAAPCSLMPATDLRDRDATALHCLALGASLLACCSQESTLAAARNTAPGRELHLTTGIFTSCPTPMRQLIFKTFKPIIPVETTLGYLPPALTSTKLLYSA